MRIFLFTFLLICLTSKSGLAQATWIYFAEDTDGGKHYIRSNGTSSGDIKDIWRKYVSSRIEIVKPSKPKFISGYTLTHYKINCATKQSKYLGSATYNMADKLIESATLEDYEQEWKDVFPETIGELLQKVCELF